MKKLFLIAATTVGFVAPMFPAFAADAVQPVQTAAAAPPLAQTLMQGQLDKCLAAGTITMEQVQAMTDDQLVKALDDCSKLANTAAAPQVITQPTFVPQPVVVSQPVSDFVPARSGRVFSDNSIGGSGGGVFNGSTIDVGGIGNTTTTTTTTQTNNIPGVPGGAGNGNPPANTLDGRIAGLQSGMQQGIANGNLTGPEAARLGAEIANIQSLRTNLGNGPLARLQLQRAIDRTTADFNRSVHNNQGIPDPNLFRSLRKNGPATTLAGNGTQSRFAALRQRVASLKTGNGGVLSKVPGNTGIAGGLFPKKVATNTGIAGGILTKKLPGNTGIAGGISSKASSAGSIHSKFVERRIEAAKVTRQAPVFTKSAKASTPRTWAQHRTVSKGSAGAPRFNRRKFASR